MPTVTAPNLLFLDCDSTLSSIEGVDELARFRGPELLGRAEEMTRLAMEGAIPIEEVFARRLELIRPRSDEVARIGQRYLETVEPTARETMERLRAAGWEPIILSGGFRPAIRPLADFLGIARVEAVDLTFHADGGYASFDRDYPTTRSGGKPQVIEAIKRERSPGRTVMVGDGASDLEAKPVVDLFVAYLGYTERAKVKAGAHHAIRRLAELPALLA